MITADFSNYLETNFSEFKQENFDFLRARDFFNSSFYAFQAAVSKDDFTSFDRVIKPVKKIFENELKPLFIKPSFIKDSFIEVRHADLDFNVRIPGIISFEKKLKEIEKDFLNIENNANCLKALNLTGTVLADIFLGGTLLSVAFFVSCIALPIFGGGTTLAVGLLKTCFTLSCHTSWISFLSLFCNFVVMQPFEKRIFPLKKQLQKDCEKILILAGKIKEGFESASTKYREKKDGVAIANIINAIRNPSEEHMRTLQNNDKAFSDLIQSISFLNVYDSTNPLKSREVFFEPLEKIFTSFWRRAAKQLSDDKLFRLALAIGKASSPAASFNETLYIRGYSSSANSVANMENILYGFDENNHQGCENFSQLLRSHLFENHLIRLSSAVYLASYSKETNDLFLIKAIAGHYIEPLLKLTHRDFQSEEARNLLKTLLRQIGFSGTYLLNTHPNMECPLSRTAFEKWEKV